MTQAILTVKNLSKNFEGLQAVKDLSFQVEPNLVTSIIGPNGAGKTTLFNLITGYYWPTSGEINFQGQVVGRISPYQLAARGIARTFQTTNYFSGKTVKENLLMARHTQQRANLWYVLTRASVYHQEEHEVSIKAEEVMQFLNIIIYRNDLAEGVPTVVKQLLAIGMALMVEPRLLLLDEPTSGMTVEEVEQLMALIGKIKGRGISVMLIEHRMRMVMGISDKILVLNFGEKIAEGTPGEIRRNNSVIAAYLGKEYVI
jgi:branched-chain amino acid transport system ATP-binding protein